MRDFEGKGRKTRDQIKCIGAFSLRSDDAGKVADALARQVSSPVRWLQTIENLISKGVGTFVEVGPGKVLSGLNRQIDRDAKTLNVEDAASLSTTLETL